MGQPLIITAKLPTDTSHRQTERWATPLQKNPFTSFSGSWGTSFVAGYPSAGWSVDLSGFIHFHGLISYSGSSISGFQSVATLPTPARPIAQVVIPIVWGGTLGTENGGALVVTTAGVLELYMPTASTAVTLNLTGSSFHPQLL